MPNTITISAVRYVKGSVLGVIVICATGVWVVQWRKRRALKKKTLQKGFEEIKVNNKMRLKVEENVKNELIEELLSARPSELIQLMQGGQVDPQDVLNVYMMKALDLDRELNCVTNVIPEAFTNVRALQDYDEHSKMLYGLPVSLKECCAVKNQDTTAGMSIYIGDKATQDSVIAATLKHCGAIPFVRTNVVQVMFAFEASNPIYGETSNHLNKDFTPGGSSSGEGSLVGAGGSPLGIGTDIAGSIRTPSHFCGICGIKPTKNRLSAKGLTGCCPGQSAISAGIGPMAQDVDTLVLAMRALLCDYMFERDQLVPPIPFNDQTYSSNRRLRIGYYYTDGFIRPVPACVRAVEMTKLALENAGHTLVPIKVPDVDHAMRLIAEALFADGGATNKRRLKYDTIDPRLLNLWRNLTMPRWLRRIAACLLDLKYPRLAHKLRACDGDSPTSKLWEVTDKISKYQTKFFDMWRNQYKLDAIICPAFSVVACPKGSVADIYGMMNYTVLYNMLNCPAGVVTITKVTADDIRKLDDYVGHYNDPWDEHVKKATRGSLNMPVSVQCVALPWQDEMCLRVMKEVQTLVKE